MKIALLSTPYLAVPPRGYGGTELIVHELGRELAAQGHEVTLFATGDSTAPAGGRLLARFDRPIWPPTPWTELLHVRFAVDAVARGGYDVVHSHCPASLAFAGDLGVPLVYTIHHGEDPALNAYYRRCRGVHYVAISDRQASQVEGVACQVVHHGLDPGPHDGETVDGGYALFLGRLSRCKGPDLAIEAARRAGVPLRVAGKAHRDDGDGDWFDAALRPALRSPGVDWVGEARGAGKRALLSGARALLMPIRWEEPFGLVMIEAMLSGCPVIAFPRGSAPEVIEEGVTGFFARDPAEMAGILRALDGFDRLACRRRAQERWNAGRMARDYLRIYRLARRLRPEATGFDGGPGGWLQAR